MAKKFVRGVTGVDDIERFDKTLTNINDLISDGQNTYVHTKKGKVESYYNLTDNVKQVESADGLLSITKEDDTISIGNVGLATKDDLKLKQNKLSAGDGLSIDNNNINIKPKAIQYLQSTNGFYYGDVTLDGTPYAALSLNSADNKYVQIAFRESVNNPGKIVTKYRFMNNNVASTWKEMLVDNETINSLLSQKQNTITNNTSIGVNGSGLQQLYSQRQLYTVTGKGLLKTHVKSISDSTKLNNPEEEFNFIVKIDKSVSSVKFTLNTHDTTKFSNIMSAYGSDNTVIISGLIFSLTGSSLTVLSPTTLDKNQVITFSDII